MLLNNGRSIVVRMVKTITILIVLTMGPIEFSANSDNKKERAATAVIAIAAKAKAAKYRHITSEASRMKIWVLLKIIRSLVPKIVIDNTRESSAIHTSSISV